MIILGAFANLKMPKVLPRTENHWRLFRPSSQIVRHLFASIHASRTALDGMCPSNCPTTASCHMSCMLLSPPGTATLPAGQRGIGRLLLCSIYLPSVFERVRVSKALLTCMSLPAAQRKRRHLGLVTNFLTSSSEHFSQVVFGSQWNPRQRACTRCLARCCDLFYHRQLPAERRLRYRPRDTVFHWPVRPVAVAKQR